MPLGGDYCEAICRVCGSTDILPYTARNGYRLDRCRACELIQVAGDLNRIDFVALYGRSFFKREYAWQQTPRGRAKEYDKWRFRLAEIERLVPGKGTILDVGCAFGYFLDVARSAGWHVFGVEMGAHAADFARRELALDVQTCDLADVRVPEDSIDVITLWNVVEHLPDPVTRLQQLNRLLRPGGLVVFTTGDSGSWVGRLAGKRWRMIEPPFHVHNFGGRSIQILLARTGYERVTATYALPREAVLSKLGLLGPMRRLAVSDKMLVMARKVGEHA